MVTEMTKYSFILLEEESEGFMQQLQQLGVVDITRSAKPVDGTSSEMLERAAAEKKAMALLSKTCYDKDPDIGAIREAAEKAIVEGDLYRLTLKTA